MKMMVRKLLNILFCWFLFLGLTAQGDSGVAKVIILKGEAQEFPVEGSPRVLKRGDWVAEGSTVRSKSRSFVKLLFIDKSQMNIGPESEMKIKEFPRNKAGIINLLKGKVRAKVTKNYMDIDKKKSKLFIKTKTAAMGVRGTDFQVIYNPKNDVTSLVTFEGAVAMAKIDDSIKDNRINQNVLESALNKREAVIVKQGQYSGAIPGQKRVSIPVKISPTQLESLKSTEPGVSSSDSPRKPASVEPTESKRVVRSIVPPGLDAKSVAGVNAGTVEKALSDSVGKNIAEKVMANTTARIDNIRNEGPPPEGFVDNSTGAYAPPAGGFVDDKTGLYVPPTEGSAFDPNAGVYIPPPEVGTVDTDTGGYVPPEGYKLVDNGEFVAVDPSREIASIDGGEPPPEGAKAINIAPTNILQPMTLDGEVKMDGEIQRYNETDGLAQDYLLETTQDFNNPDLQKLNTGRSNVEFRIRR